MIYYLNCLIWYIVLNSINEIHLLMIIFLYPDFCILMDTCHELTAPRMTVYETYSAMTFFLYSDLKNYIFLSEIKRILDQNLFSSPNLISDLSFILDPNFILDLYFIFDLYETAWFRHGTAFLCGHKFYDARILWRAQKQKANL